MPKYPAGATDAERMRRYQGLLENEVRGTKYPARKFPLAALAATLQRGARRPFPRRDAVRRLERSRPGEGGGVPPVLARLAAAPRRPAGRGLLEHPVQSSRPLRPARALGRHPEKIKKELKRLVDRYKDFLKEDYLLEIGGVEEVHARSWQKLDRVRAVPSIGSVNPDTLEDRLCDLHRRSRPLVREAGGHEVVRRRA